MARSKYEKCLWHEIRANILFAMRMDVTPDQVIETLKNHIKEVEDHRDSGAAPKDYLHGGR